jgi:4-hydroxy-tetrahydrodipicolinate reductase
MAELSIGVVGALGRMGRVLADCIQEAEDLVIGALVVRPGHPRVGELPGIPGAPTFTDDIAAAAETVDVLIDFALPAGMGAVVSAARAAGTPLIEGVTGLSAEQMAALEGLAEAVPVLWSPNMSLGVQVVLDLLARATAALGSGYDVEVVEAHHRFKRDAPSGTSLRLARAVAQAFSPPRPVEAVPIHSLRGGDVVGDHTVYFMGDGDRLEIRHRATNRRAFAMGALRAARWIVRQPPGFYDMAQLVADEVRGSEGG